MFLKYMINFNLKKTFLLDIYKQVWYDILGVYFRQSLEAWDKCQTMLKLVVITFQKG